MNVLGTLTCVLCLACWAPVCPAEQIATITAAHLEQDLFDYVAPGLRDYLRANDEEPYEKKHWKDLTPQQRDRIRERYRRFQELPGDEQARIRERHEWFKNLSPIERHQLRDKWRRLSPEERKHFRKELKEMRKYGRS